MFKYNKLFPREEVACKCGCGFSSPDPIFYCAMVELRSALKVPMKINSWCRCPVHNLSCSGSKSSSHLKGSAADIFCPTPFFKLKLIYLAGFYGMYGVGVGEYFVHLDRDEYKGSERFWMYDI